jgi:hypothetical protein
VHLKIVQVPFDVDVKIGQLPAMIVQDRIVPRILNAPGMGGVCAVIMEL